MTRWNVLSSFMLAIVLFAAVTPPRADANSPRKTRAISGRILRVETVAPIAAVQAIIRGQRIGGITAANGRFELPEVPEGSAELVLRHPCYFPVQIALPATGDVVIAIGLPFDESSLTRAGCGGLGARRPDTLRTHDSE